MEFKFKYLCSYAHLMKNYFLELNFGDLVEQIIQTGDRRGLIVILITAMVVEPRNVSVSKSNPSIVHAN